MKSISMHFLPFPTFVDRLQVQQSDSSFERRARSSQVDAFSLSSERFQKWKLSNSCKCLTQKQLPWEWQAPSDMGSLTAWFPLSPTQSIRLKKKIGILLIKGSLVGKLPSYGATEKQQKERATKRKHLVMLECHFCGTRDVWWHDTRTTMSKAACHRMFVVKCAKRWNTIRSRQNDNRSISYGRNAMK